MTFEEWQDTYEPCPTPEAYQNAKAAYSAGVQAERERCARIAESYDSKTEYSYACYDQGKDDTASDIAAAIRGQK